MKERQASAHPAWIPATVLYREIVALGYVGGQSQLRAYMHTLKPTGPVEVVLERDASGEGAHRFHAGFLDYARHGGFVIKLCRPYRAKTKGKVERFNGYLRRSFYIPLSSQLKQVGLSRDVVTANTEVRRWLNDIANERLHGTRQERPSKRLLEEGLQNIPAPWRGNIPAARPQADVLNSTAERPVIVITRMEQETPLQHPLAVYDQLLDRAIHLGMGAVL